MEVQTSSCTNTSFMFLELAGEIFISIHISILGLRKFLSRAFKSIACCYFEWTWTAWTAVRTEKRCHGGSICILLCVCSPYCAAGLNFLYKDAVQLLLWGITWRRTSRPTGPEPPRSWWAILSLTLLCIITKDSYLSDSSLGCNTWAYSQKLQEPSILL